MRMKISVKLEKRTVKAGTKRPNERTFDVVCVEMEVMLENRKSNKKEAESWRKRIMEKRERGRIIISMFKK